MHSHKARNIVLPAAWVVVLLVSTLPKVIVQEIFGQTVSTDMQAAFSIAVLAVALVASFLWRPLGALRGLIVLFGMLVVGEWLVFTRLDQLPFYQRWLNHPSFNVYMPAEQSLRMIVTLMMIAALFLMGKRRGETFLVRGDTAAPVGPVPWLGVSGRERWNRFGLLLTGLISLGTLAFLVVAGRPPLDIVFRALPYLPVILIVSATNAFSEEMTYKASFLSVLEHPVGSRQALYMVAVYFGIGHFYGIPYGVVGVLMAGFLGWLLAKSMLETRGFFWAWFIHFWQDVWIFSFLAIGSILPGGG